MARGSVKARGNSYRVRISYQDEAGKRHQVSKTASGSNQAEKLRTQLLGELDKVFWPNRVRRRSAFILNNGSKAM